MNNERHSNVAESLTIGSLFSGIGGFELGLELAGLGPVLWQCEIDSWRRQVLAKHWPDAARFTDVREIERHDPECDLGWDCTCGRGAEPVDVLCGGFPCIDISAAGKQAGLDGEHSGLWYEFARIIGEVRPRFVVVENVAALLVRGMGDVLGDLAARGYDARWDCVPAAALGAPHRRDRVFLVAWRVPDASGHRLRQQPERGAGTAQEADGSHAVDRSVGAHLVADPDLWRRQAQRVTRRARQRWQLVKGRRQPDRCDLPLWPPASNDVHAWGAVPDEAQPAICRVAHGAPNGLDRSRLAACGDAIVPLAAEVAGLVVLELAAAGVA